MASPCKLPRPLRGIVPPLVTPLLDRDVLDGDGLERLVEHVIDGGVSGLFLLGTTGEGPALSYRLRCELIDRVCDQVAGRVPVLVGVTDPAFVESVELAEWAADAGAVAVVLSAPFYFPAEQSDLIRYVEHMVAESPLPVLLYNMPSHTKLSFAPETVARAMQIPKVIGLKDSSGDMAYFRTLRGLAGQRDDWSLLIGPDRLAAEAFSAGAHGGVNGGANLWPELYVGLYEAARRGDAEEVARRHRDVLELRERIYQVSSQAMGAIRGLKCALSCLGICSDFMAEPFERFDERQRQTICENLAALGLAGDAYEPLRSNEE